LLHLFLVDLLDRVGQIIIKIDAERTDEDYAFSHGCVGGVGQTVSVKKDYFSNIEVFRVIEGIAVEVFNEYFLSIVPE
jgi:hypothetical protein